jgi:hypothetical protein
LWNKGFFFVYRNIKKLEIVFFLTRRESMSGIIWISVMFLWLIVMMLVGLKLKDDRVINGYLISAGILFPAIYLWQKYAYRVLNLNKCDRNGTIRSKLTNIGLKTSAGVPYVRPEIQLVYKGGSSLIREKDVFDLKNVLPKLSSCFYNK